MNGLVRCYNCCNIHVVRLNFDDTKAGQIVLLPCKKCKGTWTMHSVGAVCRDGVLFIWDEGVV